MKKIICMFTVVIFSMFYTGCTKVVNVVDERGNIVEKRIVSPTGRLNSYCTVEVEGCEYFVIAAHGSFTYVHKGNCKNPIHIHNGGKHE